MQELPKCDTETQSEQTLLKNGTDSITPSRIATKLLFVKKNKVQYLYRARKKKLDVPVLVFVIAARIHMFFGDRY